MGVGDSVAKADQEPQHFGAMDIQKFGPWGSPGQPNWNMELDASETIKHVIIQSGFIVDGIGFVIVDGSLSVGTKYFGGSGGSHHKIELRPNEYITQISGRHGVYDHGRQRHIASIRIHTNLKPDGYGPYGQARCTQKNYRFSTPLSGNCAITGFFGRYGQYLDSIGVSIKKVDRKTGEMSGMSASSSGNNGEKVQSESELN